MKYIIIIGLLLTLYITEPLWRVQFRTNNSLISQIDKELTEQDNKRKEFIAVETKKRIKLEEECGKKPSCAYKSKVPKPLQKYWNRTLKNPDSIHEEICTPLHAVKNGWMTSCQYKVKNSYNKIELRLDTYIIKDGKVIR